jgi:FKBP-type peptidyl-prolyl cis-trans isomerase
MKMLRFWLALPLLFGLINACIADGQTRSTDSGVQYQDLVMGSGTPAAPNDVATIHFIVWIDVNGNKGQALFSSYDRGKPVAFKIGTDKVVQGWNDGVSGMQPGGKRLLFIPARLAYGARGAGEMIPPNTNLIYEIELIRIK